jgi:uncharacterized protein (DUF1697 family)
MRTEASNLGCRKNVTAVDSGNVETKPREHFTDVQTRYEWILDYIGEYHEDERFREDTASSL